MRSQLFALIFVYFSMLKPSIPSIISQNRIHETLFFDKIRVKRQEGYVYDKPSVAFDLPTQPTIAATQTPAATPTSSASATLAPSTDKTQSQYMYYAYPAPSGGGGDTVNIGYSTAGTSVTSAAPSTSAAGVGISSTSGVTGYNYGTQDPVPTGTQAVTCTSGYNCDTIGSNTGSTQVSGTVSTNAPQYLPPLSGGGTISDTGVSVNIPSGQGLTSASTTQPGSTAPSVAPPSADSGYLPPSSPSPTPGPSPPSSPAGYLPPISAPGSATPSTVSTPASTYLPPVF